MGRGSLSGVQVGLLAGLLAGLPAGCGGKSSSCPTCEVPPPPPTTLRAPWPVGRAPDYANPIPAENARAGEVGLRSGRQALAHEIEAYADRVSVHAGESLGVHVNVDVAHGLSWTLYRIGWYGGAGARRVTAGGPVRVAPQAACPPRPGDALVQCAWATAVQVPVARDEVSGYHVVKLVRDDGFFTLVPVLVVDDRPADLLVQASVNTWQAYNAWGGESLYQDASRTIPGGFALRVSFDRPYLAADGLGAADDTELGFARFLERNGYDVTYTTDVDVALGGASHISRAGAFVAVGHDEYVAGQARDAMQAARDFGVPLLFFGANMAYWKVRLESPGAAGVPRVITCYKSSLVSDPVTGPDTTGRYRDAAVNRPENALVGIMYESWQMMIAPLVVADPTSWLFDGTGLLAGETLPGLVGYEYDFAVGDAFQPASLAIPARSAVIDAEGRPSWQATAWYRASSGALVFAAGSIVWPNGVDPTRGAYDGRVERMTANVIHAALGLQVPAGISVGARASSSQYRVNPIGPFATSVGTLATGLDGPTGVAVMPDGAIAVADARRHQILRVAGPGAVSVIAGDGQPGGGPSSAGVPGAQAHFFHPTAVLALTDGSLLVADTGNHAIRRIGTDPARTVTPFAGLIGGAGLADGAGTSARFRFPMGLARDPATGVVYVADSANYRVRAVDPAGNVTTFAGSTAGDTDGPAATARIALPTAVALGQDGRVYVVASGTARVKAIGTDAAHTVVTLAGNGQGAADGPGTSAQLGAQGGLVWAAGQLLVADPVSYRVRAIVPGAGVADTTVHTFAGSGNFGSGDGSGAAAQFGLPLGLAVGANGTIYVADPGSGAIRTIVP
ncbi:MAG TPA: N,N-dimethylformamidase beta subunit family domain-containing protein [Anaeromyxobacter sp.]|nr:N,N-dimethylformamidase beta subunit family domain-containing protein [Anaeromyxobacter sp.]